MSSLPRFRLNAPSGADFQAGIEWRGEDFGRGRLDFTVRSTADNSVLLTGSTDDGRLQVLDTGQGFAFRIPQMAVDSVPAGLQRIAGTFTANGVIRPIFSGSWSRLPVGVTPSPGPVVFDGVCALIEVEGDSDIIRLMSAPPGPPGPSGAADPGDLTLIFENNLV